MPLLSGPCTHRLPISLTSPPPSPCVPSANPSASVQAAEPPSGLCGVCSVVVLSPDASILYLFRDTANLLRQRVLLHSLPQF